jgi:Leucine-rich repeat (LRR) protein
MKRKSFSQLFIVSLLVGVNLNAQWTRTNGPHGGAVNSLLLCPGRTGGWSVLAGTRGGVFLSSDNGTTWNAGGLTNTVVFSLAMGPASGATGGLSIFAGTKDRGVFLSVDSGTTWTPTGLTNTTIISLAVSSASGITGRSLILAGTYGGGVYLSTDDGASWTSQHIGPVHAAVSSFAVIPTSAAPGSPHLFAGSSGGGVFLSTNNGASWTAVNTGLANTYIRSLEVIVDGAGQYNLLAATEQGAGVFRSADDGATWHAANRSLKNPFVSSFATVGRYLFAGAEWGEVFFSTNFGRAWTAINGHVVNTVFSLAGSPIGKSGWTLFAGSDSSVFVSTREPNRDTIYTRYYTALENAELAFHLNCSRASGTENLQNMDKLTELEDFVMGDNLSVYGFPADLKALHRLRRMQFLGDRLPVLPSSICSLPNLEELDVRKGAFPALAPEFGHLTKLRRLNLSDGALRELPETIGALSSLEEAGLAHNDLFRIPDSFGELRSLRVLNMENNALERLPETIGGLSSLEEMNLRTNAFERLPEEIGGLSKLRVLTVSDNRMSSLPGGFYRLRSLETADLSLNGLTKLSPEIRNLKKLTYLNLSFNQLQTLPAEFADLVNLEHLDLYGNRMTAKEVERIKKLLPNCLVHAEAQNVFQPTTVSGAQWKEFRDDSLGIGFLYPAEYHLDVSQRDSIDREGRYKLVASMSIVDSGSVGIDSSEFEVESESTLTVMVGRLRFESCAHQSGFENTDTAMRDSAEVEDTERSRGWVSLGRQGMQEDASLISLGAWRGMQGMNYTGTFGHNARGESSGYLGLKEFFAGFAFWNGARDFTIAISFWSDRSEGADAFHNVLSSFKIKSADKQKR